MSSINVCAYLMNHVGYLMKHVGYLMNHVMSLINIGANQKKQVTWLGVIVMFSINYKFHRSN